jgi:hypothetical protein
MNCCISAADTFMNILLKSKKTASYVADLSEWTKQREKARHFNTGIDLGAFWQPVTKHCHNLAAREPRFAVRFAFFYFSDDRYYFILTNVDHAGSNILPYGFFLISPVQ